MGNTMKKLFLLIAFGTTLVFSQDASKWSLYGGISSMNTNLEENTTNLLGTNLGFGYRFTDKLTIGMGFSQRGFTGVHGYDDSYCYWDEYNNRICFDIEDDRDEDNGRGNNRPLFEYMCTCNWFSIAPIKQFLRPAFHCIHILLQKMS